MLQVANHVTNLFGLSYAAGHQWLTINEKNIDETSYNEFVYEFIVKYAYVARIHNHHIYIFMLNAWYVFYVLCYCYIHTGALQHPFCLCNKGSSLS